MNAQWIGPRKCETGACCQVAQVAGGVSLRSSERPDETITLSESEWLGFVDAIACGDYDEVTR